MKTTLALHWKAIVNKLHPPLPLTPRDSQKLLKYLNSSFRQRLNQSHPKREEQYANDHVQSILTSPLFLNKPVKSPSIVDHQGHQADNSARWLRQFSQEPMTLLQDRIAAGAAELDIARLCLDAQMRKCLADRDFKVSMKSSGAGSIVLHWLWSSGLEASLKFLKDRQFTRMLISFLVAESRYDRIYSWIFQEKQLQKLPVNDDFRKTQSRIIFHLIKAETLYGSGLASALNIFIQTLDGFLKAEKKPKEIRLRFSPAGNYMITSLSQMLERSEISIDDYNAFLESTKVWCRPNTFEPAWLAIHHPIKPRPDLTVAYLHHLRPRDLAGMLQGRRNDTISIALKAAELCLAQGERIEVASIMEALRTHFAAEIGHEHSTNKTAQKVEPKADGKELSNVQLLESLALEYGGSLTVDFLSRHDHPSFIGSG
ncbi:MAG: hypothetical protein Q9163_005597 [Psora crenata]